MNTEYQKIIIIGYGKAAKKILEYVKERQKDYGYYIEFIEHETDPFHIIKKICREKGISLVQIEEKKLLKKYLESLSQRTLIISAGNNYIFPEAVTEKANITIINFHNALLPAYPGRNAPSWSIYMNEKTTGITWHYVSKDIDRGNIIIQKNCNIGEDTRAYELAENLIELAYAGLIEIFDDILGEKCGDGVAQSLKQCGRIYLSKEIPSNGVFDLRDSPQKIYRLLRSVDYGNCNIFPNLRTHYRGEEIEILRYRKIDKEIMQRNDLMLYLPLDAAHVLKMKYRRIGY